MKQEQQKNTENSVRVMLEAMGVSMSSEVKKNTPKRVAKFYHEALAGYDEDPRDHCKVFTAPERTGLVVLRDISFSSLCQHHLLPFFGMVSIGYVPNRKILGLSKFVRLIEVFSRRLQLQENLTLEIMRAIDDVVQPLGVAVHVSAQHLCMVSRGVRNHGGRLFTSEFCGSLQKDPAVKHEFLTILQIQKKP